MTSEREVTRRHLLVLGAAGSAAALMGVGKHAEAAEPVALKVPRRVLGKTKQSIPVLLVGGGSGFNGSFDNRIKVALDYGVNYIDTARKYAGGGSAPAGAN